MVCQACGSPVSGTFCSKCGTQVAPAPPVYGAPRPIMLEPRVQRHVQTLGILWCVFGGYRLIGGLVGMLVLGTLSHGFGDYNWDFGGSHHFGPHFGPHWMAALIPVVAVYTAAVTALSFLVGFSLLTRKPWGRTLAIVAAILSMAKPLLGTAIGIYTLWVLAPAASATEYDSIAEPT